jgi:hypothetical protein
MTPNFDAINLFSFLIELAEHSTIMFNASGKSRNLCYILSLRRKAFNPSPLRLRLAVGFPYIDALYQIKESFYS